MYFFLKEPKAKDETLISLIYYLKYENKLFKYSTGQKINPENWDFKNRLPKTMRGMSGEKNKHISSVISQYSNVLEIQIKNCEIKNIPLTKDILKDAFDYKFRSWNKKEKTQEKEKSIPEYVQLFIDSKNKSKGQSESWVQKYTNLKKKLIYFNDHKGKPQKFEHINSDWIDEYCGFLREIKIKPFKPHNDNTLHRNINFLFTFLIWAKNKHHNIDLDSIKNPVKKYQPDDVYLTEKEINEIENLDLEYHLDKVRDLFLIGVYSGQRFSDYSVFEKADVKNDIIIKKAEKTEHESFIPLHGRLKKLLDKYNWDLPVISEQRFNEHIKTICEKAEIDEVVKEIVYRGNNKEIIYRKKFECVSSHTARRTFITLSAEKNMPDHIIMKVTGIKDVKTLIKYKKTSQNSVVEFVNKIWD